MEYPQYNSWTTGSSIRRKTNEDASFLLRRSNKIIKGSRGWERLRRNRRGGRGKEGKNQVWEEMEEMYLVSGNGTAVCSSG